MRRLLLGLVAMVPAQAQAQTCGEVLLACTINGSRQVTVCLSGAEVSYVYGKPGKPPELALTAALADGVYAPWNGIGRYMSDSIAFSNAGYAYEVWQSVDKMAPDAGPVYGVNVMQGDALLKNLTCDAGAEAQPFDILYKATEAQGLCWDFATRGWQETCP
ncbi:MAG: hypothetical protein V4712_12895 [Pseudomonadota bacterium]